MFGSRTLDRLEQMLDEAIAGTFHEEYYDESKLSRLETRWKQYLETSVLTEKNLKEEKEKVKALVSNISHQIRTPMTNLKLYTALLEETLIAENDTENQERSLKMLKEIIRQTAKMEFLIQSLSKMSELESDLINVKPKWQAISVLLEESIAEIEPKALKKQMKIQTTYKGNENACYDLKWTKEALGNVLDNAVKYSPAKTEILLSVKEYEMYTAVTVKDSGRGIKETDLPKIFGRFYRGEEVQQEDGTGWIISSLSLC